MTMLQEMREHLTWVANPAAKELFTQGQVDVFVGIPPEP
jgi:hypothetical protein